ncbi:response regulator [Neorhizobium sp. P12A]|uniref:response regulator n=1 Tax=Neorhizobium sp. P12A TaxID=2268027 RepID=UPI0011EFEF86|nr:response regulator [Neorhizobium sp. P12A]KAA0682026.1 response regulator [Neorhizobium sp. P12A]
MAVIVIAEDEFLLADMLVAFLEEAGHHAIAASNGLAALDLVHKHETDLIVTDFMMPAMTGLEFAQAVRSDDAKGNIPIILVSGAQASIGRAHPNLFDAVFDKPYVLERLLQTIEDLLAKRRD